MRSRCVPCTASLPSTTRGWRRKEPCQGGTEVTHTSSYSVSSSGSLLLLRLSLLSRFELALLSAATRRDAPPVPVLAEGVASLVGTRWVVA